MRSISGICVHIIGLKVRDKEFSELVVLPFQGLAMKSEARQELLLLGAKMVVLRDVAIL